MRAGSPQAIPTPGGLLPTERSRLVSILGMLGSEFPGERAAAGLKAVELLRGAGLVWDVVIAGQDVQPARCANDAANLALCRRHAAMLNPWEARFVSGVTHQARSMTPAQELKLWQTAAALRARGFA